MDDLEAATARAYDRLASRHPVEFRQLVADELSEPSARRPPRATRLGMSRPMPTGRVVPLGAPLTDVEPGERITTDGLVPDGVLEDARPWRRSDYEANHPTPPEPPRPSLPSPAQPTKRPAQGPTKPAVGQLFTGLDQDGKRHAARHPNGTGYALCRAIVTTGPYGAATRLGCHKCRTASGG